MPDSHDFWKESERRYRMARRLMDEMYWLAPTEPETDAPGAAAGGRRMVVVR